MYYWISYLCYIIYDLFLFGLFWEVERFLYFMFVKINLYIVCNTICSGIHENIIITNMYIFDVYLYVFTVNIVGFSLLFTCPAGLLGVGKGILCLSGGSCLFFCIATWICGEGSCICFLSSSQGSACKGTWWFFKELGLRSRRGILSLSFDHLDGWPSILLFRSCWCSKSVDLSWCWHRWPLLQHWYRIFWLWVRSAFLFHFCILRWRCWCFHWLIRCTRLWRPILCVVILSGCWGPCFALCVLFLLA